jgi:hypothetical protein
MRIKNAQAIAWVFCCGLAKMFSHVEVFTPFQTPTHISRVRYFLCILRKSYCDIFREIFPSKYINSGKFCIYKHFVFCYSHISTQTISN